MSERMPLREARRFCTRGEWDERQEASNPETPPARLLELVHKHPRAVMDNPGLLTLSLEQPALWVQIVTIGRELVLRDELTVAVGQLVACEAHFFAIGCVDHALGWWSDVPGTEWLVRREKLEAALVLARAAALRVLPEAAYRRARDVARGWLMPPDRRSWPRRNDTVLSALLGVLPLYQGQPIDAADVWGTLDRATPKPSADQPERLELLAWMVESAGRVRHLPVQLPDAVAIDAAMRFFPTRGKP